MTARGHSDIDQVREATDLVRLVSDYVALQPRGREYVGLCPFHDDHKPSFSVVTHKGSAFFNCFACGASGDCFRFVMRYHGMEFAEALRFLAERAGITLQGRSERPAGDGPGRRELLEASRFAMTFFQRTLADPDVGTAARAVIEARGIPDELVEPFMLGASPPGFDGLLNRLGGKASAIRTAELAGLLKQRSSGGHYDAFRNRLMFPICDEVGRPVAFGGRSIDPEDEPKYLNSSENPIFRKSRVLYGLHLAKRSMMDSREVIITEGYTDVIACHGAGFQNAVGTMGTALTAEHATILARLVDTVILVFDGDNAGMKAADRAVEVFFTAPVDVRICVLPDGLDPDDLLRQPDGAERFRAAMDASRDALAYKLDRFREALGQASGLSARQRHLEQFLRELGDLGFGGVSGVRKRLVLSQLADLFGLTIADIEAALPAAARPAPSRVDAAAPVEDEPGPTTLMDELMQGPAASRARQLAERELIGVVLFDAATALQPLTPLTPPEDSPDATVRLCDVVGPQDFADPAARVIAELVFPWLREGADFGIDRVLGQLDDERAAAVAAQLFRDGRRACGADEGQAAAALSGAVVTLRQVLSREAYASESAAFRPGGGAPVEDPAAAVLEQIRRRSEHGDLPAAIATRVSR